MEEKHTSLDVEQIQYDAENPRIKMALEKYGDHLDAERIHFALKSGAEGSDGASSYNKLRDSIRTSGGIQDPISVVEQNGKYVCIDGNTRLAIYKQFIKEKVSGDWSTIKTRVMSNASQRDIETIRVSAHLIGPREWPAYEKARYLHYLRSQKFMDYNEMVALCGGNKSDIERQIDAYHDMNEYYRDKVENDTAFKIDRFSGFVELQKPKIKEAIFDADLDLKDFGEWIRDGKIYRLTNVRDLPRVLGDEEAKNTFINGGPRSIEKARKLLDRKDEKKLGEKTKDTTLGDASVYQLAKILIGRIDDMPFSEINSLKKREQDEHAEQIRILENLAERLQGLLDNVGE